MMIKENYNASAMRQLSDDSLVKHTNQRIEDILTKIDREARKGGFALGYPQTYRNIHSSGEVADAPFIDDQVVIDTLISLGYKVTSSKDNNWVIAW